MFSGCAARSATRKHLAARSRYVGLLTLLIPLRRERLRRGFRSLAIYWERLPVVEVAFVVGGGEEVAMKLSFEQPASLEQRAARKAVIDGMGRALRGLWKDEPTAPLPERLLHLLAQLEQKPKKP